MRILKTLRRLLKNWRLALPRPQWTSETDPEQPNFEIEVLRNPDDSAHTITVSVGGFKDNGNGAPYFLIAETHCAEFAPRRTTLKGTVGEARAVGEEWAAEW